LIAEDFEVTLLGINFQVYVNNSFLISFGLKQWNEVRILSVANVLMCLEQRSQRLTLIPKEII